MKYSRIVSVLMALAICTNAQAGEIVFAQLGGVQLVSKPVDIGRDDYLATIVEARAVDPSAALVTFANISITGQVAQLHGSLSSAIVPWGNAFRESAGALYGEGWSTIDTHLLIEPSEIGGGVWSMLESNDGSLSYDGLWSTAVPIAGIGPIRFESPTDAFSLLLEFQHSSIDFAYIVTPANADGDVRMTLGLLGSGIVNAGEEGGAAFGYDGNPDVVVPFAVPEPSAGLATLICGFGILGLRFRSRHSSL